MPRPPADPDLKALCVDAVRAGESARDVSRRLAETLDIRVSHVAISRWVKEAATAPAVPALAPAPPAQPETNADDVPPENADTLTLTRWMRDAAIRDAGRAKAVGHYGPAAQFMKRAADLAPTIARLEKASRESGDLIRVSRADVEKTMGGIREKVAALLDRPLLCAHCGRALSVAIGHGTDGAPGAPSA